MGKAADTIQDVIKATIAYTVGKDKSITHKFHPDVYGGAGFPDMLICFDGVTYYVEVKSENDRLSQIQKDWAKINKSIVPIALVARSKAGTYHLLGPDDYENFKASMLTQENELVLLRAGNTSILKDFANKLKKIKESRWP